MTEREFATGVVERLQAAGYRALWAGGCVRDELLGLTPADYDVATDARPEQVTALFRRAHTFGASFGVVELLGPRGPDGEWLKVQVATFRSDVSYSDGRRPDAVKFSSPEEDAQRRDFTINGMFFDPVADRLIDFVGGKADLDARVLRAIGDPVARFTEDKLRILRAVRLAARFELLIDPATRDAARRMAGQIRVVSAERIAEELRKMLTHRTRATGLRLLRELELVGPILPELVPLLDQSYDAGGTGWDHTVRVLGAVGPGTSAVPFPLALAAVLHAAVTAEAAAEICRRLRLSNDETDRVAWLVGHHASLRDAATMPFSRLQPLLIHPGIGDLLALHRAIAVADGIAPEHVEYCERVLRELPPEKLNPPPLLSGNDLRAHGLSPGPEFKRILDALRVAQLDEKVRTRAEALRLVDELRDPPEPGP